MVGRESALGVSQAVHFTTTGLTRFFLEQLALTEALYTVVRIAQEFKEIRSCDQEPWTESIGVVCTIANGVKVSATPH